jgi:two-component system sensor histidine kinase TctE
MPRQRIDARAACEEVVVDHVNAALSRGIDLGVEGSNEVTVLADATLLREALGNLIDNAIRYAKPGGQVTVSAAVIGGAAHISVSDDGPGVPPSEREKIFERFHRGENSEGAGSGLGLPVALLCARAMGGNLTLAGDDPGSGATFVLHLQVAAVSADLSESTD